MSDNSSNLNEEDKNIIEGSTYQDKERNIFENFIFKNEKFQKEEDNNMGFDFGFKFEESKKDEKTEEKKEEKKKRKKKMKIMMMILCLLMNKFKKNSF